MKEIVIYVRFKRGLGRQLEENLSKERAERRTLSMKCTLYCGGGGAESPFLSYQRRT